MRRQYLWTFRNFVRKVSNVGKQQWEWRLEGACRAFDPGTFYPETEAAAAKAKRICEGCEVLADCRAYAMNNRENSGVWGGLSERERRRIWRKQRQSA